MPTATATSLSSVGDAAPSSGGILTVACEGASPSAFTDEETEAPGVSHWPKVASSVSGRVGV